MFILLQATYKKNSTPILPCLSLTISQKQSEHANFQTFIYRSIIQITNLHITVILIVTQNQHLLLFAQLHNPFPLDLYNLNFRCNHDHLDKFQKMM